MSENLWKLREMKGFTPAQLATRAGISLPLLLDYESGRPLRPSDQARLARALYVEADDIKVRSDPRPPRMGGGPADRPAPNRTSRPPASRGPRAPRTAKPKPQPKPPAPARPGQIEHLQSLAQRLGLDQDQLTAEVGKPLLELNQREVKHWLTEYQTRAQTEPARKPPPGYRAHRAYLPEAVDAFELNYLNEAKTEGRRLRVKLISGETIMGTLLGFSAYALTLRRDDGGEVTLQKLAIAYYECESGGGG